MCRFKIILEFLPAFFSVFTEYGQGPLVLTCSKHFDIDVMLLQQPMEIGQLRNDADGAKNCKRCAENLLTYTGHHVATTGSHLIDTHRQWHAGITDTHQL